MLCSLHLNIYIQKENKVFVENRQIYYLNCFFLFPAQQYTAKYICKICLRYKNKKEINFLKYYCCYSQVLSFTDRSSFSWVPLSWVLRNTPEVAKSTVYMFQSQKEPHCTFLNTGCILFLQHNLSHLWLIDQFLMNSQLSWLYYVGSTATHGVGFSPIASATSLNIQSRKRLCKFWIAIRFLNLPLS